ncbi:holin [Mycobacterium phage TelAviv]|uniref:Holin n=1 Tax=Mycobacterium phage Smooch TaxID=2652896 RepID=A0A5P8DDR7_BPMCO|nr:holin [Mycobacterium phage Familton]QFP96562.1 holin [Mycobacterium phage Smooch]QOC58500.1 holin [Mycobacterium phage Shida]QPO16553.1 holin [Mycobacterium phage TelAviv]QWY81554.1 holin [Mycobacterium phage Winget]
MSQMTKLPETAKAIAGVIVGVLSAVITRATTEGAVLPSFEPFDTKGWVLFVAIAALGYFGVYLPPNRQNARQLEVGLGQLTPEERSQVLNTWAGGGPR